MLTVSQSTEQILLLYEVTRTAGFLSEGSRLDRGSIQSGEAKRAGSYNLERKGHETNGNTVWCASRCALRIYNIAASKHYCTVQYSTINERTMRYLDQQAGERERERQD